MKQNKGITLIALIITVIVLLILAGVAISMVLGENGLLNNSKEATQKYKDSQEKEGLSLILSGYYMAKLQDDTIDLGTYLSENNAVLKEEQTDNYIIEYNGYEFTVKKDSLEIIDVQKADGITPRIEITQEKIVGKTTVTVKIGNYADFVALGDSYKNALSIKVTKVSDGSVVLNTTASEEGSFDVTAKGKYNIEVTAVSKSNAGGDITKTAKRENYEVAVTYAVSSISVTALSLEVDESKSLEVITVPADEVEELTYTSSDTSIATVDNTGKVTGIAVGSATITVAGKTTTGVTGTCTVTVKPKSITVTAEQIAADPKTYYGARVTNYTQGASYRIFYVDTANKYGDGTNTVYLIADSDDSRTSALGTASGDTYTAYAYDASKTKIKEMNPLWSARRGTATWGENEKAAAYLCDTSKWTTYYDSTKANYVIGSPSLEMYVDSYNQTHNANSLVCTYDAATGTGSNSGNGYFVGANGTYSNSGYYTDYNTIDTAQNGIYLSSGYSWLASPSANATNAESCIYGLRAYVHTYLYDALPVRPLVSLRSDIPIKIEM